MDKNIKNIIFDFGGVLIDLDVEGDTYFPYFEQELFVKEINEEHGGKILYRYVTYIRK